MAVTGIDGQSRTIDEAAERPMQVRYEMAKYGCGAKQFEVYSCSLHRYHLYISIS